MIDLKKCGQEKLVEFFKHKLPSKISQRIKFFDDLDLEYLQNAKNNRGIYDNRIFALEHIINKNWRGLWLRATGMDCLIYITWLYTGLINDEFKTKSLIDYYKETHPEEKFIPYSITAAEEDKLFINSNINSISQFI